MSQTVSESSHIEDNTETTSTKPLSEGLKMKIKAMQEEFQATIRRTPFFDSKTIENSENASEFLYDRLHGIEKNFLNKVSPPEDWRAEELKKLQKALIDGKQELINAFEGLNKRSSEATQAYELDLILDELDNSIQN